MHFQSPMPVKTKSTYSKMRLIGSLVLVMGLASCVLKDSHRGLNESGLYDPDHITLKPGVSYDFEEGFLVGHLQRFHSQYSYQRAIIIGNGE